jgi:diphosphate-dependent phosphofructokinase
MATVRNLAAPVASWKPIGIPLAALLSVPAAGAAIGTSGSPFGGADGAHVGVRPVIASAPVDTTGAPFKS